MSRRKRIFRLTGALRGQTMAEYALILATIAVIATAFVQSGGVIITALVQNVCKLF